MYFQLLFAVDRVRAWRRVIPNGRRRNRSRPLLKGDMKSVPSLEASTRSSRSSRPSHSGMTTEEFEKTCTRAGSLRRSIRRRADSTRRWCISRCSSCSATFVPMGSRRSSFPEVASSSCAPFTERTYGVSSRAGGGELGEAEARASRRETRARETPRGGLRGRQGRKAGGHSEVHRPPSHRRVRELRRGPRRCSSGPRPALVPLLSLRAP